MLFVFVRDLSLLLCLTSRRSFIPCRTDALTIDPIFTEFKSCYVVRIINNHTCIRNQSRQSCLVNINVETYPPAPAKQVLEPTSANQGEAAVARCAKSFVNLVFFLFFVILSFFWGGGGGGGKGGIE